MKNLGKYSCWSYSTTNDFGYGFGSRTEVTKASQPPVKRNGETYHYVGSGTKSEMEEKARYTYSDLAKSKPMEDIP